MKNWAVVVQLVDEKGSIYRENRYEMSSSHLASNAAFDLCSYMEQKAGLLKIDGEDCVPEE